MSLASFEQQAVLRQLQKARAVALCIRIAIDYPDDDLDVADAVRGLVTLIDGAIVTLDQPKAS